MPLALEPSGAFRFVRAPYLSTIDEEDAGAAPAAPPPAKNAVVTLPSVSAPPEPPELPFLRVFLKYRDESGAVLRNAVGVPSSEAVVPYDSQMAAPSVPDDIYRLALRISKKVATLSKKSFEELMCFSRFGKLLVLEGDYYELELTALDRETLESLDSYVDALRAQDRRKAGKKRDWDDLSDFDRTQLIDRTRCKIHRQLDHIQFRVAQLRGDPEQAYDGFLRDARAAFFEAYVEAGDARAALFAPSLAEEPSGNDAGDDSSSDEEYEEELAHGDGTACLDEAAARETAAAIAEAELEELDIEALLEVEDPESASAGGASGDGYSETEDDDEKDLEMAPPAERAAAAYGAAA